MQVDLTHAAQLSEGIVYVTHAHPLPSIVGEPALPLPLLLLLGSQVLVGHRDHAAAAAGRRRLVLERAAGETNPDRRRATPLLTLVPGLRCAP